MIRCAIMQPTYLPWAGYFNLIAQSDIFVFLDDAQFQKNSWHNRNRILVNHSPHWITIPIRHSNLTQTIAESSFAEGYNWQIKHPKLLRQTYAKHPFANDILQLCNFLEDNQFDSLAELNVHLIKWFMVKLNLNRQCFLSSELSVCGTRTERLINILEYFGADIYLSPQGAAEYLAQDNFVGLSQAKLVFQDYQPAPYTQYRHYEFESHLSIVDVIANIGLESTKSYIN